MRSIAGGSHADAHADPAPGAPDRYFYPNCRCTGAFFRGAGCHRDDPANRNRCPPGDRCPNRRSAIAHCNSRGAVTHPRANAGARSDPDPRGHPDAAARGGSHLAAPAGR